MMNDELENLADFLANEECNSEVDFLEQMKFPSDDDYDINDIEIIAQPLDDDVLKQLNGN
jgi:hypothetical protein